MAKVKNLCLEHVKYWFMKGFSGNVVGLWLLAIGGC